MSSQPSSALPASALAQIFTDARTCSAFLPRPVDDATVEHLYALLCQGPTAFNASPARFTFVRSPAAKEKLRPALMEGNRDKTMAAPLTVIVAYDTEFHQQLPTLYPQADVRGFFQGKGEANQTFLLRNGGLQGAYLILAARALGLDCGPMSGFDNAQVDATFFSGTSWCSNFLVNLGYGDAGTRPRAARNPRLPFDQVCQIL